MRHIVRFASVVLVMSAAGCGTKVLCGAGTTQVDNECVALASANPVVDASVTPTVDTGASTTVDTGVADVVDAGKSADVSVAPAVDASVVYRPIFGGATSAAPASASSLAITWKAALDPQTPQNEMVYRLYMGTAAGKEDFATPYFVAPAGATSALVTGLTAATDAYFVVRAVNKLALEDGNTVEVHSKPDVDTVPPNFDAAFTATATGAGSVKLEWGAATDDKTPKEGLVYAAYWATKPSDTRTGVFGGISQPGATSMAVTGLPKAGFTYYFRVEARDAAGNAASNPTPASAKTSTDSTAPAFSGCVQTLSPSAGGVNVTWARAVDDSTDVSAMTYNVYASTTPYQADGGGGFDFTKPSATFKNGVLTGRVGGLTKETQYYFICRAQDQEGNEDTNTVQVGALTGKDSAPPSFGGVISATRKGNVATLTWMPASDDQTPSEAMKYLVFQGNDPEKEDTATPVAISQPGATSVDIPKLASGTFYYWLVRAQDEAGNLDSNKAERGLETPTTLCFDTDIFPILSGANDVASTCNRSNCHSAMNPPQGLDMSNPALAYANLVNVPAVEDQPGVDAGLGDEAGTHVYLRRKRIKAPDPNLPAPDESFVKESYLYLKITSDPDIIGSAMPPNPNPALSNRSIAKIRNWILQGALRSCN